MHPLNVNSDSSENLLRSLGANPNPQALLEHAEATFGIKHPTLLDLYTEYEHIVTLHSYDDQNNFYDEMESLGSRGYTPERICECTDRADICRSTTYLITPIEAARLEQDPRVLSVEPHPELLGHQVRPLAAEFSANWNKSGNETSLMKNWGLLRVTNNTQISGWGSNGTVNQSATMYTTSEGYNVDVVVFDGNLLAGHPEYAVNADGSGGTRCVQYNWWSLNPQVTGQPAGNYNYSAGATGDNGHGMHVAGIMAGNTQGWARGANIYQISPYGEQTNGTSTPTLTQLVNYIRYWHNHKAINPATGRRNPTVVNMSFGSFGNYFPRNPSSGIIYSNAFNYRGTTTSIPGSAPAGQTSLQAQYNGNWTVANWLNGGVQLYKDYADLYGVVLYFYTNQDTAAEQAIIDGSDEGIIWFAAAGNQWDEAGYLSNHPNYNNYLNFAYATIGSLVLYTPKYHNRLPTPAAAFSGTPGTGNYKTIGVVGNIGSLTTQDLSITSSSGNKLTIWAPGENIMSSYNTAGVADPRNAAYYIAKLTGTSMASPQVSGVAACLASQYPNLTQAQALTYLQTYAQSGVIPDPNNPLPGPTVTYYNLREAPNLFLGYYYDRPISGSVWPQERSWIRPNSGAVYPRPTIQRRPVAGVS